MNRIVLVGYMAANPESKTSQTGNSVTTFRVSVKNKMRGKEGAKYSYFNCIAFKHTADYVYKYCNSQSRVAIEGSLETSSYTDRNGAKRYNTQIVVDNVEVISSTVNAGDFQQPQEPQQPDGGFMEVSNDDDLPFL